MRADQISLIKCYDQPFGTFAFNDLNENARVRLDLDSLRLPLPQTVAGPFGIDIDEVLIPGHLAPKDNTAEIETGDGFRFRLADKGYRHTRLGLELEPKEAA